MMGMGFGFLIPNAVAKMLEVRLKRMMMMLMMAMVMMMRIGVMGVMKLGNVLPIDRPCTIPPAKSQIALEKHEERNLQF